MVKRIIYNYAAVFAVLWALIVFALCATPGEYIPSEDWMELLSVDKLVHASIFFVLMSLCLIALKKKASHQRLIFIFFVLCAMYGVSLEIMQATFFRNRSMDYKDMIANTVGCMIALIMANRIFTIFARSS